MENEKLKIIKVVRRNDQVSGILWILVGFIQLFGFVAAMSGLWNILLGVIRLLNLDAIKADDRSMIRFFEERKIIVLGTLFANLLSLLFLILGKNVFKYLLPPLPIVILLVFFDFYNRSIVLNNRKLLFPGYKEKLSDTSVGVTYGIDVQTIRNSLNESEEYILLEGKVDEVRRDGFANNGYGIITTKRFLFEASMGMNKKNHEVELNQIEESFMGKRILHNTIEFILKDGTHLKYIVRDIRNWENICRWITDQIQN